ncbi:MAG: carboxy terminal-processing peptidase, partial [Planctomycetaceae bacterium]|nr:carboxy terminal-processing peptidase [Planctomycetaceae bacterium]
DDTPMEEARERLHKRYHNIATTLEQTENSEKLEAYLSALTHCFDPHSSYMSPETLEDFQISMRLRLEGIGAALRSEDGYTTVASIVPGGAAAADGRLKVGDKIIGVAQAEGEFVDIVEMKLSKVVRYIRGPKGTQVRLQVKTADTGKVTEYELTRQEIELKSSEVKGEIIQSGERLKGTAVRVGVVHIPSFYRDFDGARAGDPNFKSTSRDVRKVLEDFEKQGGVDIVVVDLRTNGGGALSEAIEVSGLFIDLGPVVQVKQQDGAIKSHDDEEPGVAWDGPMVVLCNRLSASASEIFAGVIKDYQRGLIVGDSTTHGKGTVQNVMMVGRQLLQFLRQEQRGALKLTINQFYRVNGDSTQNHGVRSDIVLPSLFDHMDLGESSLDNALPFDQIKAAAYQPLGMVKPEIVSTLRQNSAKRVAADPEFKKLSEQIARYVARKERPTITLNEEKLRAERELDKKDKEKEDEADQEAEDKPIFPQEHYNDEVLHITVDYLNELRGRKTAAN